MIILRVVTLILTFVCTSAVAAHASPRQGPPVKASLVDPCWSSSARDVRSSVSTWRTQINRRTAIYVIQHLHKACRILAESSDKGTQSPSLVDELNSIRHDIYAITFKLLYHAHRGLENTALAELSSGDVRRTTPRDIRRATAIRLSDDLTSLQQRVSKFGAQSVGDATNKDVPEKALQPFIDATAELAFAEKIVFDAYPDLFTRKFDAIPNRHEHKKATKSFEKALRPEDRCS
jgi:hypothetical protein